MFFEYVEDPCSSLPFSETVSENGFTLNLSWRRLSPQDIALLNLLEASLRERSTSFYPMSPQWPHRTLFQDAILH